MGFSKRLFRNPILILAGPVVGLGLLCLFGAANVENAYQFRLVGTVNTSGTQTSPATEDTLSAVSTVLGGGETPKTGTPTALADGVTTPVVSRVSGKKISVRAVDLTATAATRVWLYKIAASGDATTLNVGWETAATGGRLPVPTPGFELWQAGDGQTLSAKSVGGASAIQVWYVEATP